MNSIDRRNFLRTLGALGVLASAPRAGAQLSPKPRFDAFPFSLGVASGYPLPTRLVLWTRLAPRPEAPGGGLAPEPIPVRWEVARDESMRSIVASGNDLASPEWGHSVHVDVQGLEPDRWYWYRFAAGDAVSPTGRTRTAPAAGAQAQRLRFAFASCQHYEQGYFGAYRHMLRDDLDLIVFVGDYIYETSFGRAPVRKHNGGKAFALEDFRKRYALYKSDPDLQAAHAACPWILTWDDHEVENDYANDRSINLDPPEQFLARRAAAYKAYYEHMPLPHEMRPRGPNARIYTRLAFGGLANFHVLDTRQYRTPQPCPRPGRGGGNYLVDCVERTDPKATMLGETQERWLGDSLASSKASWNIIAQETLVAQLDLSPGPITSFWTDSWDGYPAARKRMLESIAARKPRNPVFIGGDMHMFWVSDLAVDPDDLHSPVLASEFNGTSITSRSLVEPWYIGALMSENGHIKFGHSTQRGYTRVEVTPKRLAADLCVMDTVETREANCTTLASFIVEDGRPGPKRV